jgi:hypothetical protein
MRTNNDMAMNIKGFFIVVLGVPTASFGRLLLPWPEQSNGGLSPVPYSLDYLLRDAPKPRQLLFHLSSNTTLRVRD